MIEIDVAGDLLYFTPVTFEPSRHGARAAGVLVALNRNLLDWCEDTGIEPPTLLAEIKIVSSGAIVTGAKLTFEHEADAVHFKLRWL